MRRSTSAWTAAVLGTALSGTTLVAQQQSPQPPPVVGSGTASSAATIPGALAVRGARYLVRNGWDYLKYQQYDRALTFFREAESRKSELTDSELQALYQGLDRAKRGLRETAAKRRKGTPPPIPVSSYPTRSGTNGAAAANPVRLVSAGPEDLASPAIEASAPAAPASGDSLPPLPESGVSGTPAPLPASSAADPAPTAPALPPSNEGLAELPPLPLNASDPVESAPAPTAAPAPTSAPDPNAAPPAVAIAPEGEAKGSEARPPASDSAAPSPESLPPLPQMPEPPPADPAPPVADPAATQAPATPSTLDPQPASEPLPQPTADVQPQPAPEPLSQPAAEAQPVPEAQPQPAPELAAQPAPEPQPDAAAQPTAAEPIVRQQFRESTAPMSSDDTFIPRGADQPFQSTLSPELQREVDRVAELQEEDRRLDVTPPGRDSTVGNPAMGGGSLSGTASPRLDITRAPSPTEARPIRPIPIPDEFVPLPQRDWSANRKYWSAAATCHLPLYFQDAALERYGHSTEVFFGPAGRYLSYPIDDPRKSTQRNQLTQPFFSIGLFAAQIVLLPYNLVVDPPWEAEYDLGYYRPGDRVPPDTYYLPLTGVGPPLHGKNY